MARTSSDPELDDVWQDFHRVVNMTSRELRDWLRTANADETTEPLPEEIDDSLGWRVADVLSKRKTDLTDDDVEVMRQVIDTIRAEIGEEGDERVLDLTDAELRERLLSVGHDALRPAELQDRHGRNA